MVSIIAHFLPKCYTVNNMAKATKKSGQQPNALQKAKARFLATYYNNPARDLKIIAVAGNAGRDITAHYIQSILKHKDELTGLIIDPKSTSALYKQLFATWKSGADYVVVSTTTANLANHLFYGLPIHVAVLTDNIEDSQLQGAIIDTTANDLESKSILFNTKPDYTIINRDESSYETFAQYPTTTATRSYGRDRDSDLRINRSKLYKVGTEANFTHGNDNFDVATYVTSQSAVFYMAAATLTALSLGLSTNQIIDGIADYEPGE